MRHIQLKTSIIGGKTADQKVHAKLAEKPSGCVVWIYINKDTLHLGPFFYFGVEAGALVGCKIAKHTKGNKYGVKAERQNLRVVPKGRFTKFESVEDLYTRLFAVAYPPRKPQGGILVFLTRESNSRPQQLMAIG